VFGNIFSRYPSPLTFKGLPMFPIEMRHNRPINMALSLLLLTLFFLCTACGKKGVLIPPDGYVPTPVSSLQVVQQGDSFRISWLAPDQELSGTGSSPIAGFRLYRRELRSPADECTSCGIEDILVRSVDLEYLQDVVREGNLFVTYDGDVQRGKSYLYKVTTFEKGGGESRDSGRVKRKKVTPPPVPVVTIGEVPAGMMLVWSNVQVPTGSLVGYTVYRSRLTQRSVLRPLNPRPVTENRYEDLRMEQDTPYRYVLRTVAIVEGETVESDPSAPVEGKYLLP
jgi:predicted small lipoprotein YifL